MSKLLQEIVHPLLDLRPGLDPAMHLEDILAQPAPQLLDGVEPGSIGRQPDRLNSWVARHSGQDVRVGMNVPVVLDYMDPLHRLGVSAIEAGVELDHLLSAHDVAIEVVHLSGQGVECTDGAPLLIVPRPWGHRRFHSPHGRNLGPALIAKLIQKQRHHGVRMPGGVAQTAVQPAHLAGVIGIRTEQASTRRVQPQPTALQHPPYSTQRVVRQPIHRRSDRAQRPAAGCRATGPDDDLLACGFTRPRAQGLQQFLLHGLDLREVPSGDPHPVGDRRGLRRLPLHRRVTSHRVCPGPAASARLAAPRHGVSPLPQSVARRYTARGRRGGYHDRDSVPVPVVPASLVLTFVGWPSPFSCCVRWLYITDFDHQNSLGATGGGYGDPLQRDPQQVLEDVRDGYYSVAAAERDYGVIISESLQLDEAATEACRRVRKETM